MPELEVPEWLKFRGKTFSRQLSVVSSSVRKSGLATVCEEARCPNRTECWSGGTATFMLMGDTCTRGCKFCAVKTSPTPPPLDPEEPKHLIEALRNLELGYIVLTSVDRDDLPDGGATHLANCIKAIKHEYPNLLVEILIPDFQGNEKSIKTIVEARPDVIAHNVETVKRLQKKVRDSRASYEQSLFVLKRIKELSPRMLTKSSIMLGLSEAESEVIQTMKDLRENGVDFLTIGQYMRPTFRHMRVREYIHPEKFDQYREAGLKMGFKYVASGPLVRSSYRAGEFFIKEYIEKAKPK
ncbi:MAG: lipoyl synthase [Methanobacteriota archaeon]|nr:MAG: lipoyl synthase [Euryarchaeota archaeon]